MYYIKCDDCNCISCINPTYSILDTQCPECGSCDYITVTEYGEKE